MTIKTVVEWIAVADALPNVGDFVLVSSLDGLHTYYAQYTVNGFLAENSGHFSDFNSAGAQCQAVRLPAKPTHWAKLPHVGATVVPVDYQSTNRFEISRGRVFTIRAPGKQQELKALIGGNVTIDGRVYELIDVEHGCTWIGREPQDFALVVKHDY
jgi:hypothetical protein